MLLGFLRKCQGVLPVEDGGADPVMHYFGEAFPGRATQNQDGLLDTGIPQLQTLCNRGNAEEIAEGLQQSGNGLGTVAVSVCLDDGHDLHTGLFPDREHILLDRVQINGNIVIVKTHSSRSMGIVFTILS